MTLDSLHLDVGKPGGSAFLKGLPERPADVLAPLHGRRMKEPLENMCLFNSRLTSSSREGVWDLNLTLASQRAVRG